ncbi:MAG: penicillin-binding protein activator LpoB [Planctomycetota bacterium]
MNSFLPAFLLFGAFAVSCSSIDYGDPEAEETLTIDYGSTDLQSLAADMVESLNAAPGLSFLEKPGKGDDTRLLVYMGGVENKTSEHIDTAGITDKMQAALMKQGKFRFVAAQPGQNEIGEQVRFQQGSGRVREEMQREFGKQLGADVVVYGSLRSIDKRRGGSVENLGTRRQDKFFQFVLKAADIDTGELIWVEESEIRKSARTGLFGRT